MTLINISIKGGPGSGNWGHRGIPGKVGGSRPRSAGLSPTSGKGCLREGEFVIMGSIPSVVKIIYAGR